MTEDALTRAVYDQDRDRFDILLEGWNGAPSQLTEALVASVYQGPAWLGPLLERGADVNACNRHKETALIRAATLRRSPDTIRFLLANGAKNQPDLEMTPATILAARDDLLPSLIALLDAPDTDPDARTRDGWTALMAAAKTHQRSAVDVLLNAGAGLHTVDKNGMCPFLHAALGADLAILKRLQEVGADLCRTSPVGMTALMLTVVDWGICRKHHTRLETMRWLCAQGIDVDARNTDGRTALLLGHEPAVVRTLIKLNADVNAADAAGETALLRAVEFGAYDDRYRRPRNQAADPVAETIELLLSAGASVDDPRLIGRAAAFRCPQIVRRLADAGAAVREDEALGLFPLMCCADSYTITRFLTSRGMDVNARDRNGRTPLHHAAGRYNDVRSSLRWLIKRGAQINALDQDEQTPLMRAAATNRDDTVRELLALGADPLFRDRHGKTARDIAQERGTPAIAAALNRAPE